MKIIVDTREQKPLFTGKNTERRKLEEGDYNTEALEPHIIIERKSPGDLYGSIIAGHQRFARMLTRARFKGLKTYIVVECQETDFYNKQWKGGYYTKVKGNVLAKIIKTMTENHGIIFIWCKDRNQTKTRIREIININNKLYNIQ